MNRIWQNDRMSFLSLSYKDWFPSWVLSDTQPGNEKAHSQSHKPDEKQSPFLSFPWEGHSPKPSFPAASSLSQRSPATLFQSTSGELPRGWLVDLFGFETGSYSSLKCLRPWPFLHYTFRLTYVVLLHSLDCFKLLQSLVTLLHSSQKKKSWPLHGNNFSHSPKKMEPMGRNFSIQKFPMVCNCGCLGCLVSYKQSM